MKEFIFHGIITKEDDQYMAVCLELDITTRGEVSPEEARGSLKEAVERHIESFQEVDGKWVDISKFTTEEAMETYAHMLSAVLNTPDQFMEFYQFKEVALIKEKNDD